MLDLFGDEFEKPAKKKKVAPKLVEKLKLQKVMPTMRNAKLDTDQMLRCANGSGVDMLSIDISPLRKKKKVVQESGKIVPVINYVEDE